MGMSLRLLIVFSFNTYVLNAYYVQEWFSGFMSHWLIKRLKKTPALTENTFRGGVGRTDNKYRHNKQVNYILR